MGLIRFDIRYPSGQRETMDVEGERALIGSASFSDVRLPMDQAAYEHVLVEARGDSLRAEARADHPPATINGMPLTASPLSPDAILGIGQIRIHASWVSDTVAGPTVKAKDAKKDSSSTVRILILLLGGAAAALLLMEQPSGIAPPPSSSMELFPDEAVKCPQSKPDLALAYGQEQMDIALGKQERMPFAAHEGVEAVTLYETAAACFQIAKEARMGKDAAGHAKQLKRALRDDFRARRLRLKHMLAVEDWELVRADVRVLQALTEGQTGEYVTWLAGVRKRLDAQESK